VVGAVLVTRELLFATRLHDAAVRAGLSIARVDEPSQLPPASSVRLALIDWGERRPDWPGALRDWWERAPEEGRPRIILFGPHTDLEAHAASRAASFGPMWARSKLLADLDRVFADALK
jgi:hypothetical protein